MYQDIISKSPTPIVLSTSEQSPAQGDASNVGYVISNNGPGIISTYTPFVSISKDFLKGYFVKSIPLGRTVFGAKYSFSSIPSGPICAFWCVFEANSGTTSSGTIPFSSCKLFPFLSSGLTSGEDTFCFNSDPVNPSDSVFVGVVFSSSGADISCKGAISISQYDNQESFFQPMKG